MKKSTVSFVSITLFVLSVVSIIPTASATLIKPAETVYIQGNDAGEGSYRVKVVYSVYDGTSLTDPKGQTNDVQISFVLTHLGGVAGGDPTVLKFGRFWVSAPNPLDPTAFYTKPASATTDSYVGTSSGNQSPRLVKFYPPSTPTTPNGVEFWFNNSPITSDGAPLFQSGDISKQLVVRTSMSNLPTTIHLEIDSTNPGTAVDGGVFITIPEPCSMTILGGAFVLLYLKRGYRK